MKYYSEQLKKFYDSADECAEAEKAYEAEVAEKEAQTKKLAEERKARAKEIEEAYKQIIEAQKEYNALRKKFIEDYGSFHMTFTSKDSVDNLYELFENVFKFF